MANYRIVGNVEVEQGGWRHTRQIPSFVVEGDVLGIVDEDHAERIAKDIIDPFDVMTVTLTAWRIDGDDKEVVDAIIVGEPAHYDSYGLLHGGRVVCMNRLSYTTTGFDES